MLKVKEGNLKAYKTIFNKFSKPIMSYIYQFTHDLTVSEELTQEVFLKVYRVRDSYEPKSKLSTWLWTIAKNTSLDYIKKKKTVLLDDYKSSEEDSPSMVDSVPHTSENAEALLINKSSRKKIEECLDSLPFTQKEAVSLRIFSEMGHDEISNMIGKSISSIKSLINRGRKALILCLERVGV